MSEDSNARFITILLEPKSGQKCGR